MLQTFTDSGGRKSRVKRTSMALFSLTFLRYSGNSHKFLARYFSSIVVGAKAELNRVFEAEDVTCFAELTGDTNPIHLDEQFARSSTKFGRCVVHGALVNGLISALHGTVLPGPGCIVVSQEIKYLAPLFVGEEVNAKIEVLSYRHHIMKCSAKCIAVERNEVVLQGETKLVVPKE